MGEKIVLQLSYIHLDNLKIEVDDPDKCSIDLFVDLLEGAAKNGMILPKEPTLWYEHDSQSIRLKDDSDLVKMFSLFHDEKLIKLSVGSAEAPCLNLQLARRLIESKSRLVTTTTEPPLLHSTMPPKSSHASASFESDLYGRKIPKTTAKRKGTFVPKVRTSLASGSQPTVGNHSIVGEGLQSENLEVPSVNVGSVETELCGNNSAEMMPDGAAKDFNFDDFEPYEFVSFFYINTPLIMISFSYKAFGHNSRSCKGGLTARELKEQGVRVVRKQTKKRKPETNLEQSNLVDGVMSSAPWNPGSQ